MKKFICLIALFFFISNAWAGGPLFPLPSNTAYDATVWDGSLRAPTQNAVRDKLETV